MKRIEVKCLADHWTNRQEVEDNLKTVVAGEPVLFQCVEGVSITHCGLLDFILEWQKKTNHPFDCISVSSVNHNDQLPFTNIHPKNSNGCWGMSNGYQPANPLFVANPNKTFGLFIGRSSVARNVILYEVASKWPGYFLLSKMREPGPVHWNTKYEDLPTWLPNKIKRKKIKKWFENGPIVSIDNKDIRDQFGQIGNSALTNKSLLSHYHLFGVELVAETMTLGTTFYPTEKTVRPISALKPFVTFATAGFLKNLQELGFQTFSDIWDESYDNLEGAARWQAIKLVIADIIANPVKIMHCQSIVEHNQKIFKKLAKGYP